MLAFSYNISTNLNKILYATDLLRQKIVLAPLPPSSELRLKWEARINRIYWNLALDDTPLTRSEIAKLLISPPKRATAQQKGVLGYKQAMDYVSQNWLVNQNSVTPNSIHELELRLLDKNTHFSDEATKHFLNYIQTGSENPIIQAGIAHLGMRHLLSQLDAKGIVGRLASYLFLYKAGSNFRDMLVLEEYWKRDFTTYQKVLDETVSSQNLNSWLVYWTQAVFTQAQKILAEFSQPQHFNLSSSFWKLSERQQNILNLLDHPNTKITNQTIQKHFKVSQITSSRDLAKLASLGLVFQHGKGRSVYYTRV